MARKPDHPADGFDADDTGGVLSGLLAEEEDLDRRALWRIGSWGVGATGAVVLAVMANQSSLGLKRDQVAAADLTRQAQQIQLVARETQNEARRLASAIDTLNGDRDRLYTRVTSLELGLDSVTGTISRQASAPASSPAAAEPQAAQNPPAPAVAPVATTQAAAPTADKPAASAAEPAPATVSSVARDAAKTDVTKTETKTEIAKPDVAKASPATPLVAAQSMMAPPDPAAGKLIEPGKAPSPVVASPIPEVVASAPSASEEDEVVPVALAPKVALQRTEFGVDLGSANSVSGLRALWLGLLKSKSNAPLTALRPIIVVKEASNGLGMQLRLVAGPLNDAGAAARICAVLTENKRPCDTAIFDGQRLSLKSDAPQPAATKPAPRRRGGVAKRSAIVEEPAKKPETSTTLSSFFGRKNSQ